MHLFFYFELQLFFFRSWEVFGRHLGFVNLRHLEQTSLACRQGLPIEGRVVHSRSFAWVLMLHKFRRPFEWHFVQINLRAHQPSFLLLHSLKLGPEAFVKLLSWGFLREIALLLTLLLDLYLFRNELSVTIILFQRAFVSEGFLVKRRLGGFTAFSAHLAVH